MPYSYGRNSPTSLRLLFFLLVLLLLHFGCFLNNSDVLGKFIFQVSVVYVAVFKSVVPGPVEILLEMQVLEPHSRPIDSDSPGAGLSHLGF